MWQWVVTPKAEAEGKQSIIWNIELKDSEGTKIRDLPTVVVEIDIKPKLGIPSWILGSNFTLATLVSGIYLNWAGIRAMKQSKQYEKRQQGQAEWEREQKQLTFNQLLKNYKKAVITKAWNANKEENEFNLLYQFVYDNEDWVELLQHAPKEDKDWFKTPPKEGEDWFTLFQALIKKKK